VSTESPYYNEPGYERKMNTAEGEAANAAYTQTVRLHAIRWAMVDQLLHPNPVFAPVIHEHFRLRHPAILERVDRWQQSTSGSHTSSAVKYAGALHAQVSELQSALDKVFGSGTVSGATQLQAQRTADALNSIVSGSPSAPITSALPSTGGIATSPAGNTPDTTGTDMPPTSSSAIAIASGATAAPVSSGACTADVAESAPASTGPAALVRFASDRLPSGVRLSEQNRRATLDHADGNWHTLRSAALWSGPAPHRWTVEVVQSTRAMLLIGVERQLSTQPTGALSNLLYAQYVGSTADQWALSGVSGSVWHDGGRQPYAAGGFRAGDRIEVCYDPSGDGSLEFVVNGSSRGICLLGPPARSRLRLVVSLLDGGDAVRIHDGEALAIGD
jgi:SPRY domain